MTNGTIKRILVVHNKYQIRGGEDSVVENEIKMLKEHGHDVFEYYKDNSDISEYTNYRKIVFPFVSVYNREVAKEIKSIVNKYKIELIHVHNTHMIISPAVFYVAREMGVPVVMTVHNFRLQCVSAMFYRDGLICEDCLGHSVLSGVKHRCYRSSLTKSLMLAINNQFHRMTGIYSYINFICLSEFNKEKLLFIPSISENKVFVKPNFSKPSILYDSQESISQRDIFLYFGRVESTKGVDLIFDAFKEMPEKMLIIAGIGQQLEELETRIEEEHINNIEVVGWCDKKRLGGYLHRAKAVVCASRWFEGHPMVVVESFASGVPVITGDIGNIGAIVEDGINGVKYRYNSKQALVEAVRRFEKMNQEELRKNAYFTFTEKYSEEENYKQLFKIYNTVAKQR